MSDIPKIDVIRHWIGWSDDEFSSERVDQFHLWLDVNDKRVADIARLQELERIVNLIKESFGESYHNMGVVAEVLRIIRTDN